MLSNRAAIYGTKPKAPPATLPDSFIQEVRARVDVVDIIGRVVALKKSGSNFFGCCPFHSEKSPSFSVAPAKQFYHCFGCGKNGDAISFLQEHAGLSFREAIAELAQGVGLMLPSMTAASAANAAANAESVVQILSANELAARFYRHCLKHSNGAKDYLRGRGLTGEAAQRFVLGYAPAGWQPLEEAFKDDYARGAGILSSGLVIEKDGRRYDRFRDRIIFGIRDPRGRLLGFGGRSMDGSDPKYLNSPESALFDKGGALFGVFEAREAIRKTRRVIVTEGYMDTIATSMAGLQETVATMGTACTDQHLERLMALAPKTVFAFDGDGAGVKAAWRAMNNCLPCASDTHSFHFLILPGGQDPDELIRAQGVEAFETLINGALSLSGFMLTQLAKNNNGLATAEDRARFMSEGLDLIQLMPRNNLARILRGELTRASQLAPEDITKLALRTAGAATRAPANRVSPWRALTEATAAQPTSAATHAQPAIETLPPDLQDAFFDGVFDSFPQDERTFWRTLFAAVTTHAPDTETDLCVAQRDLVRNARDAILAERARQQRDHLRDAYRSGNASDEALLRVRPAQT
jgi:DNA primase